MKTILFIETTETGSGKECAQAAISLGYIAVLLTSSDSNYQQTTLDQFSHVININTRSPEQIERAVFSHEVLNTLDISAVFTTNDFYVQETADLATKMNLIGIGNSAANACCSKLVLRQELDKANLSEFNPKYEVVQSVDLSGINIKEPRIIKPIDANDSVGVKQLESNTQLAEYCRWVQATKNDITGKEFSGTFLLEEIVDGTEFSVEAIVNKDKKIQVFGIFKKMERLNFGENNFIKVGAVFPYLEKELEKLSRAANKVLKAIKAGTGIYDIDCKVSSNGNIKILEVNGRLVGDQMASNLIPLATGINICSLAIELLVSTDIDLPIIKYRGFAAIVRVFSPVSGYLKSQPELISNMEKPKHVYITPFIEVGALVSTASSNQDILASVICLDQDPSIAYNIAQDYAERLGKIYLSSIEKVENCSV